MANVSGSVVVATVTRLVGVLVIVVLLLVKVVVVVATVSQRNDHERNFRHSSAEVSSPPTQLSPGPEGEVAQMGATVVRRTSG